MDALNVELGMSMMLAGIGLLFTILFLFAGIIFVIKKRKGAKFVFVTVIICLVVFISSGYWYSDIRIRIVANTVLSGNAESKTATELLEDFDNSMKDLIP